MTQVKILLMNEEKGPPVECVYFLYNIAFYFGTISLTQGYMKK